MLAENLTGRAMRGLIAIDVGRDDRRRAMGQGALRDLERD
jgi:hypothetical protein